MSYTETHDNSLAKLSKIEKKVSRKRVSICTPHPLTSLI